VKVTEHDPLTSVHVEELKLPVGVPVAPNVTVPVGVLVVPAAVSVTVAVQVVAWLRATVDGVQLMAVDVVRRLTVMVVVPGVPAEWLASPL